MIRRHPWATAGAVATACVVALWYAIFEAWWAYQGRNSWGRP